MGQAVLLLASLLVPATPAASLPSPEARGESKADAAPDDKPFDDVVRGCEVRRGLFTFYVDAAHGRILLEILPDQLDRWFLLASTVEEAPGERGLYGAQVGPDFHFRFHRVGNAVQWLQRNNSFVATEGTPEARALPRSFSEGALGWARLQARPQAQRGSLLVDAGEMFARDVIGLVPVLNQAYAPTVFQFDRDRSALVGAKARPDWVMLDVRLHYTTDDPKVFSITLPDPRSALFLLKYELSTLESTGYQPRIEDDRVGLWDTVQQDLTTDDPSAQYVRYANRWQLEKVDPGAPLSPPKRPIVFWLENTIPVRYREWMREGILLWNKAFERIGFKDAIVVKQQPDDADWEPAETRYSTVRWFASADAAFANGYSRANPRTGQIYDADITISDGFLRMFRHFGSEFLAPAVPSAELRRNSGRPSCTHAAGLVEEASFSLDVLAARGELTPDVVERLMHEAIVEVLAHEVGHTLGLRHNFRASTMLKLGELSDLRKTEELGQSASVMDYNAIVIAPKGTTQGHFCTPTLGPYDYWAIEYAYEPVDGDERAELARMASRATADPRLLYGPDEDALGTFAPESMDPLISHWDQSDDPLAFYRQRLEMVRGVWADAESKLLRPGEGYQVLRRSVERGLAQYYRGLLTASKYLGGVHLSRDHVGDPSGRAPYTPVPAARQREALALLKTHAFAREAFELPAGLHNRLAIEHLPDLDYRTFLTRQRLDYPWHDAVLALQRPLLDRLYHPITLGRILDNELRFSPQEEVFRMADLFEGLDAAIWSELDGGAVAISSLRRNLQREQVQHLLRVVLRRPAPEGASRWFGPPPAIFAPPPPPPFPEDATTLARASLERILGKIRRVLRASAIADATTRAHLEETQARIAAALEARAQRLVE